MSVMADSLTISRTKEALIRRFDTHQILQHIGLMTTFILLVVTGFPLKFPDAALSQWWVGLWGGIDFVRSVHHVSAWVMIGVCVYHAVYLVITILLLKRPFPFQMIPTQQDLTNIFQELQYFVGIRKDKPQFDRFNWREKFDYWAIFWGIPVMGISGFILMYPTVVTKFLPGWVVPTALIAHSDEAVLAVTWIFLVHIFFNHFSPGIFPLNKSIFTGRLSKRRYQIDHPLEYERLQSQTKQPQTEKEVKDENPA